MRRRLLLGTSVYALNVLATMPVWAQCAAGDGQVNSAGICATPQTLAAPAGTVVSGATLTTGTKTADTISGTNSTLSNAGSIVSSSVSQTVLITGSGASIVNPGVISNSASGSAIVGPQATTLAGINNSGTISTQTGAVIQTGPISGTFTNSGFIGGTNQSFFGPGVQVGAIGGDFNNLATGTISVLTNAVAILGNVQGNITNAGEIRALQGNGLVVDTALGAFGTLQGNLTNSGALSGSFIGFGARLVAGNLNNSGHISGGSFALLVGQLNGSLTNTGTIVGSAFGVDIATIANSITNSGTIAADQVPMQLGRAGGAGLVTGPILNTSTGVIGQIGGVAPAGCASYRTTFGVSCAAIVVGSQTPASLVNKGMIIGTFGPAVELDESALNLTNTGTILGGTVALNYQTGNAPSTITQAGGLIQGNILLSPAGDTVDVTGGAIIGTISGPGATVNFNLGSGSFVTQGPIEVDNININSGNVGLLNDVTASGTLTNDATLQLHSLYPDPAGLVTRNVSENFTQGTSGTLVLEVDPSGADQLHVTQTAKLGGNLLLVYDPGTYTARTDTIVTAAAVNGQFASAQFTGANPGLPQAIGYTPTAVDLFVGTAGGTQSVTQSASPAPAAIPIPTSLPTTPTAGPACTTNTGIITTTGLCSTQQTLTAPHGTVVSGATIATLHSGSAYTIVGTNSTLTNAGVISGHVLVNPAVGFPTLGNTLAVLMSAPGAVLINNGMITTGVAIGPTPSSAALSGVVGAITNNGRILGGVSMPQGWFLTGDFVNHGLITGGVNFEGAFNPGNLVNTGTITGLTFQLAALEFNGGLAGTLNNSGAIMATPGAAAWS